VALTSVTLTSVTLTSVALTSVNGLRKILGNANDDTHHTVTNDITIPTKTRMYLYTRCIPAIDHFQGIRLVW
jgi:hypothetical protein